MREHLLEVEQELIDIIIGFMYKQIKLVLNIREDFASTYSTSMYL